MPKQFTTQVEKMLFAAELVRRIGDARVFSSNRLRDYFIVDDVRLWEIIEPTLAAFEVPRTLDADNKATDRLKYSARSRLAQLKYRNLRRKELNLVKSPIPIENIINDQIDVLLFGYSGYMERDVITPLTRHIRDAKLSYYIITDNNTSSTAFTDNTSEDRLNIWVLWNHDCDKELSRISKDYKRLLDALDHKILRQLYDSCGAPCSLSIFAALIRYVFNALLPHYFYHIVIAQRLYKHARVKWNISPDVSDPRIRAFCLVGRNYKAKWADIQFGIYSLESVEWIFCQSDFVFVWGEFSRNLINNFGVQKDLIHVTGSPKFDSLVSIKSSSAKAKRYEYRIINVLFCSIYALKSYANIPKYMDALNSVKADVVRFATQNPRINLTIKLHPLEDASQIRSLVSRNGNIVIVNGSADIRDYIKECDVFITMGSTSTIDAILLDKAVIFPNYDGLVWWDDIYLNSEVTIQASTSNALEDLLKNIARLLEVNERDEMKEKRKAFISKWVYFSDEESSKIILRATGLTQQQDSVAR